MKRGNLSLQDDVIVMDEVSSPIRKVEIQIGPNGPVNTGGKRRDKKEGMAYVGHSNPLNSDWWLLYLRVLLALLFASK